MRLDGVGDSAATVAKAVNAGVSSISPTPHAGVNPDHASKPDMQALRDICAGKNPEPFKSMAISEIPICSKTWWEDGEQYECLMDKGHKEQKHGLRGMVRKLDAF